MSVRSRSRATARATRSAAENAKRVRELQRKVKEMETSGAAGASEKLKSERAAWERERALLRRGITEEEDAAVVEALYNRLPPKDRPTITEWLDNHAKEPDKAPKSLRPFLGVESAAPVVKPAPRGSPPPRSSPRETSPGAGGTVTPEAIRAAGERARKEGTDEAKNAYKAIRAKAMEESGHGG